MCGIAGIVVKNGADRTPFEDALGRMVAALAHRGPDDRGTLVVTPPGGGSVLLANTRLAIQDPSPAGHQPMRDEATGNAVVFNGEIYNFHDLRRELSEPERDWTSATDTEVVLRAWERWGAGCLERLRGMFAFALWDAAAARLVLARDAFGIKPLYYAGDGERFLFASEVRALLASGLVSRRLSRAGLRSYLSFGCVESPLTIVEDVRCLEPGHLLLYDPARGAVEKRRWFRLEELVRAGGGDEPARAVREALESSVRAHLVSDVPVGAFLSGGIDSTAVVALMSRVAERAPRTFSVVFPEPRFSEEEYSRAVARRFRTEHEEVRLTSEDLLALLPDALGAMDQPTIDGVNTYVVARALRRSGLRVALSGLGADELFGGYPTFARLGRHAPFGALSRMLARAAWRVPRAAKRLALHACDSAPDVYARSRELFPDAAVAALADGVPPPLPGLPATGGADAFAALSLLELGHYMANMLLRDTDAMSMASSVEVRVPFVDREVVGAVLAVASARKRDGARPKPLLLDALGTLVPEEVWKRPKRGFELPFELWMRDRLRPEIGGAITDARLCERSGLAAGPARDVWTRFLRAPRWVGWSRPWALYVLLRWVERNAVGAA